MKKVLSFVLSFVLVLTMLPFSALAKEKISRVELTSDIASILVYDGEVRQPTFTVTNGAPVYCDVAYIYRYNRGSWELCDNGKKITAGTWIVNCYFEINRDVNTSYELADDVTVSVDGVEWTIHSSGVQTNGDRSFVIAYRDNYTVDAPPTLEFMDDEYLDIQKNFVDEAISAVSVSARVTGGTEPYTFSKTSGPEWITVSDDGRITGTPSTAGANSDLVVRVTDAAGDYKEITIAVAETLAKREVISSVELTSDLRLPLLVGSDVVNPEYVVSEDAPFTVISHGWYEYSHEWVRTTDTQFMEGKSYRLLSALSITSSNADLFRFDSNLTVKVNGVEYDVYNIFNGATYCNAFFNSPEYETHIHSYTDSVTKPTCIEKGYTTHTCECGDSYIDTYVDALGHTSDEGTVTKTATYTEAGEMTYKCMVCGEILKTEEIAKLAKKANTLSAKGKTVTLKAKSLKKKNQTVKLAKAITVKNAKGAVTFKKSSGNKKITVAKNGKITVKKGLKKGTYKVKVKVTAAGNKEYKAAVKTVTVTIKVK